MAKAHNENKKHSAKESNTVRQSNTFNKITKSKSRIFFFFQETKRPISPPRPVFAGTSINGLMQDSVRLLDAHLIFEPILTCLGVMPQQMINNISNSG